MAFAAFADAPVDAAVIEVGMGGSWDATNVADGSVAVITPIAVDHSRYLGEAPEVIAQVSTQPSPPSTGFSTWRMCRSVLPSSSSKRMRR